MQGTGDILEYNYACDQAKRPLQKLPQVIEAEHEAKAEEVCARSKLIIENLVLPGVSQRHLMPPVPLKSQRIRD